MNSDLSGLILRLHQQEEAAGPAVASPLVAAVSWFGDAGLLAHVAIHQQGAVVVQGKSSYVFHLPGGRRMTGQDFVTRADRPWHDSAQLLGFAMPGLRPPAPPRQERCYLLWRQASRRCA